MGNFHEILTAIDQFLGGSDWFIYLLLGTGVFFTIYLGFPQFRHLGKSLKIVSGKLDSPEDVGDTSHFEALATALSGTIGTGNIAGVALAIHLGGPAALFWMIITALVGMTTKLVEVTMSHKYRETASDGTISGGPMYYMKNALNMKWLAIIFALATILSSFGTGSLPQINSISNALFSTWGINKIITGAVLSICLFMVILGGIKRIAKVTSSLVPIMSIIYLIGALAVITYNWENIIPSIVSIASDFFTGTAATGGFLGASIAFAINRGVNRGLFSNEAGQGSAPIAHAAAKAEHPVSEGLVALLEPFIDTIVICTITGLTILSSGVWKDKLENQFQGSDMIIIEGVVGDKSDSDIAKLNTYIMGDNKEDNFNGSLNVVKGSITDPVTIIHARSVAEDVVVYSDSEPYTGAIAIKYGKPSNKFVFKGKSLVHSAPLTAAAFSRSWFGDWGSYIVTIGILLFAFSTAISWSYYGNRAVIFIWGSKYVKLYQIIYVLGFFLAAFTDTTIVWTMSGIAIALMTIPNLLGIFLLRKDMKKEMNSFLVEFKDKFNS